MVTVQLVLPGLRSEVLTNHAVLVEEVLVADLNGVQLLLEFLDVLFLGHLHLLEDLLLGVELTIEVLRLGHGFVDLVLEFDILLVEDLDLPVRSVELDLAVLDSEHLILQVTPGSQQL